MDDTSGRPHWHLRSTLPASISRSRAIALGTTVLVAAGLILRLVQYASGRSLWMDEVMLALNIVDRPLRALFGSLERDQVAPFGFLALERAAVIALGAGEAALRFVPVVAGCVALVAFRSVARRLLDPAPALVAVGLFAISQPLIYFSSEVKQYSTDVCVAVVLMWFAVGWMDGPPDTRRMLEGAIAGMVAVWVSHSAVFTLAAIGVALALALRSTNGGPPPRDQHYRFALVTLAWVASFAASYGVTRHAVPARTLAYMRTYWAEQFIQIPRYSVGEAGHAMVLVLRTFVDPFGLHAPYRVAAIAERWSPALARAALAGFAPWAALLGAVSLARRRRLSSLALLVTPAFGLVGAAAIRAYPLGGRTSLFLAPTLFLLIAQGVWQAWQASSHVVPRLGVAAAAIAIVAPPAREALALPYMHEELRPVLEHVARRRAPGDAVYVYYAALQSLEYYGRFLGLPPGTYTPGVVSRADPGGYRADVRRLSGVHRVWVVLSHDYVVGSVSEWQVILHELDAMGTRLECYDRPGARACLYDLSRFDAANSS